MKLNEILSSIGNIKKETYMSFYPNLGISVIKNKPKKKGPNEWSEKQKQERIKFKAINSFAYANKTAVIKPIWNLSPEVRHSGYNLFKKYNSKAFGANGEIIDASVIYVSNGSLSLPKGIKIKTCEDKHKFLLSWSKDNYNYKNQYEDTLAYATFIDDIFLDIIYTNIKRKDLSTHIKIDDLDNSNDYVYIFFTNKDRSAFSNSRALRFKD